MLKKNICIVGTGYVGLPVALAFAKAGFSVSGFDINEKKIKSLGHGIDESGEFSKKELESCSISFTSEQSVIKKSDYIVVAVPTPIDKNKNPELSPLKSACELIGKNLNNGSIVIFESTVYPGVTEEVCIPILEKSSSMKCPSDFKVGYSPERISPGDKEHTIDKIVKIVSGIDDEALEEIAELYSKIIKAGVYKAPSIKVAEAAKVIENTQRDLNIALVNELALIFDRIGISTKDVIDAASTKWNFHPYRPGLVGGHCISVDPHYLLYKSRQLGYDPKVILTGRGVNEYMPVFVAEKTISVLKQLKKNPKQSKVLVLGLTFKENLKDIRNSKAKELIAALKKGAAVYAYDPLLDKQTLTSEFNVGYADIKKMGFRNFDAVIITVLHDSFKKIDFSKVKRGMKKNTILFDVKGFFSEQKLRKEGFVYLSL